MSTYSNLHVHVVFSTQGRAPTIGEEWRPELHGYMAGILRNLQVKSLAINGTADHVHLLMGISPSHRISDIVRELKKASNAWAREHQSLFAWQDGYGAFAVSQRDLPMIRGYIARQESHHHKLTSQEEMRALLEEAGIEIDEGYFSWGPVCDHVVVGQSSARRPARSHAHPVVCDAPATRVRPVPGQLSVPDNKSMSKRKLG